MLLKLLTIVFFFSILSQSLQHSSQNTEFTFNGFYPPLTDISVQGIASITPKGVLKLTNIDRSEGGHAFYNKPIRFKDSPNDTVSSFSTTFVFAIDPLISKFSGPGMAFVIAPRATAAPIIINNGNDTNHVLAVELDTVQDPFDPDNNHVGIDINSLKSVKTSPSGYWNENDQFNKLSLVSGKPMQVWVDYDGRTHQINVTMAPFRNDKPKKPLVSIVRDLSSVLLQDMFVGFSSATSSYVWGHLVLGWSFRVKGEAPLLDFSKLPQVGQSSGIAWFEVLLNSLLIVGVLCTIFLLIFLPIRLLRCISRRRRKFLEEIEDWETEFAKNRMKFKDLYYATKGFKDEGLLGRGGFGSVYKGVMPKTQKEIAVKRVSNKSQQGLKEFVAEIASIGRMSHRNLVPLLGYCRRKDELLLVYDYMPNGSLDKYLHNSPPEVTLDWKQRIKIIKGVASALFFLHEDWEQVVIHRDVKSSNVLLDADHNGRLGDFGLARLCGHGTDPETTNVAGTWGYLDPDHVRTGRATTATDVFAFGVLLLEVACGRRPIEFQDSVSGERVFLVDWVFQFWIDGNILDAKDPNLLYDYDQTEMEMVLKLGLLCSQSDPENRPTMRQVLHYLSGDVMLPNLSPSDLLGSERLLGIPEIGFSESSYSTGGSSVTNSLLSGGR